MTESEGPVLDRAAILAANDLTVERVNVPKWGTVCVRVMSGVERRQWEKLVNDSQKDASGMDTLKVLTSLVAKTVCDEQGNRLFSDEDAEALAAKSGAALLYVATAAQRINALTDQDVDDLLGN